MKHIVFVALALLAGLVLGGWAPRSEVARLKKELAANRELLRSTNRSRSGLDNVTRMIGIDRTPTKSSPTSRPVDTDPETPANSNKTIVISATPHGASISAGDDVRDEELAEDKESKDGKEDGEEEEEAGELTMEESIEKAMELWKVRSDMARNTLISNVGMSDAEIQQFDLLVADMNAELTQTFTEFAEDLEEAEEVQMEAGIRIFNDVTDSIVNTYDAMDRTLEPGWRRAAGSKFTLTDFISPDVARPLIGVEDKLDGFGGRHHEGEEW